MNNFLIELAATLALIAVLLAAFALRMSTMPF